MKASALTLLAAASPAFAAVHELWWNLTYVENANPDGLQPRRVIGVNGTWPSVSLYLPRARPLLTCAHRPPPIEVTTNDTLLVHATNSLDAPSSLHHHGMFFNSTSWMDGAVGVSQW